jgi:TM2 domain-containing membrane protein YozV
MGKLTAAILSLIVPGLGQFYSGRIWRGLAVFMLTGVVGFLTGGIGLAAMMIIAAVDAYNIYGKA